MQAIRLQKTIEKNGELSFQNLPVVAGQEVEVIVLLSILPTRKKVLTARELLNSSLIGLWEERDDITDSLAYARQLLVLILLTQNLNLELKLLELIFYFFRKKQ